MWSVLGVRTDGAGKFELPWRRHEVINSKEMNLRVGKESQWDSQIEELNLQFALNKGSTDSEETVACLEEMKEIENGVFFKKHGVKKTIDGSCTAERWIM